MVSSLACMLWSVAFFFVLNSQGGTALSSHSVLSLTRHLYINKMGIEQKKRLVGGEG